METGISDASKGGGTDPEPVLGAMSIFDAIITEFKLQAPKLTSDPLSFYAEHLKRSVLHDQSNQNGDLYSIQRVIHRISMGRRLESDARQARDVALEKVLDALRRSQAGWQDKAAGHPNGQGSCRADAAAMLVLEAIFEADLQPEQYAYRPERSALDAVRHVHKMLCTGHGQVVDADLSGYFDSIPHAELMRCVARRVSDGAMLHLIKM
jgi:hypothetical protein